jgi:hypothetical protein
LLGVVVTYLLKIDWRHDLEVGGNNNNNNGSKDCVANGLQASFSNQKHQVSGCKTYLVGCMMFAWEISILELWKILFFNINDQCIFFWFVFVIFLRELNV